MGAAEPRRNPGRNRKPIRKAVDSSDDENMENAEDEIQIDSD